MSSRQPKTSSRIAAPSSEASSVRAAVSTQGVPSCLQLSSFGPRESGVVVAAAAIGAAAPIRPVTRKTVALKPKRSSTGAADSRLVAVPVVERQGDGSGR